MRRYIRGKIASARRRLPTPAEAEPVALGILILLLFVAAALFNGFNYGPRIWRPEWRCAANAKGAIVCAPIPKPPVLQ
jgi:hypothetical protein